jgi:hypothetical protein
MSTKSRGGLRWGRTSKRGEQKIVVLTRQHGLEAERTWQTAQLFP